MRNRIEHCCANPLGACAYGDDMTGLDALDARILLALDDDPEITTLALARRLGVARNTAHARLRRLLDGGALRSFSHRVAPAALGHGLTAFVSLAIAQHGSVAAMAELERIPQVLELHATTGDMDLLLKVVARDTGHLYELTERIVAIEGVTRSSTSIALRSPVPSRVAPLIREVFEQQG